MFAQQVINSLAMGCVCALAALGFVLIYIIATEIISFGRKLDSIAQIEKWGLFVSTNNDKIVPIRAYLPSIEISTRYTLNSERTGQAKGLT